MNKLKQILIGITLLNIISILNLQAQTSFNAIDDNNFQLVEKTSEDKLFHCEVPCGIFNDKLRIELVKEHITTIEKSMKLINQLSKEEKTNYNQLVRWITTKEKHANKIQEIVSQYFLHQRVKIKNEEDLNAYNKYIQQLESLHHISVYAMKSKQSTDLSLIEKLQVKVKGFEHLYFTEHNHKH